MAAMTAVEYVAGRRAGIYRPRMALSLGDDVASVFYVVDVATGRDVFEVHGSDAIMQFLRVVMECS